MTGGNSLGTINIRSFGGSINDLVILLFFASTAKDGLTGLELWSGPLNNGSIRWQNIGFVEGAGNSKETGHYIFWDKQRNYISGFLMLPGD